MMEETSGSGVWVLIGVELGFYFSFFLFFPVVIGVDRRCLGS